MKYVKNILILIVTLLVLAYIAFLAIVPFVIESKFDKKAFASAVFELTKLKPEYPKVKIYTTPSLNVGFKFTDLKLMYPDDKQFMSSSYATLEFSAIDFLSNKLNFSKISLDKPVIDLIVLNNGKTKINDFFETNLHGPTCGYKIAPTSIQLNNYKIERYNMQKSNDSSLKGELKVIDKDTIIKYVNKMTKDSIKMI